ncbi:MAG TPA: alpha/beta hydrolase [Solirubrobacteraceae bacterium]|nr:alpha/beta hydrolase [Solirubrobacteraceae bacterium]
MALTTMSFATDFTDATATGTARAISLRLTGGDRYRLRTCVWAKAPQRAPQSKCETTQAAPNLIGSLLAATAAPTASLTIPRPAAGEASATIAGLVVVDELRDGLWVPYASSWPAGGLSSAGVAVPAVGEASGSVLTGQGITLPGVRQGGIDTLAQDSICVGPPRPAPAPSQGSGTALGTLAAPYEVEEPARPQPVGIMILLHGGTWMAHGPGALGSMHDSAARWRARGWRTVNGDYRPCGQSVDDALALFDRVRATYGDARPICIGGQSAGGHLAMVIASRRPQVSCVVSEAGVADLTALASESAYRGPESDSQRVPIALVNAVVAAFGADRLAQYSPTASGLAARVLFGIPASDSFVPWSQATDFAKAQASRNARAYVDVQRLEGDDVRWGHGTASTAAVANFRAREERLIAPLVSGAVTVPAAVPVQRLLREGLRVTVSCPSSCRVHAKLVLDRRTASRLGIVPTIGAAAARRKTHGSGALVVRLSSRARRALPRRARLRVVVEMSTNGETKRFVSRVRVR